MGGWVAVALVCAATQACAVFTDLEDCRRDEDCPRGQYCHPEERFCEIDKRPIVIGASLPMTGELGDFGQDMSRALDLAVLEVESAGGVLGRPLQLDVRDDETSEERAVENVTALVQAGVSAVIGPATSSQVVETASITYEGHVVQITPSAGAPELSTAQPARDRWLFRTISTVRGASAAAMASFAWERPDGGPRCTDLAILYVDDAIGNAYRDAIGELFTKQGGCVVLDIALPAVTAVDYEEQAAAVIDAAPGCGVLVAYPDAGVEILGEVAARATADATHDWSSFFWLATSSLHGTAFLEASTEHPLHPAEGVYGGDEDSNPLTIEYNELRGRWRDVFGLEDGAELPLFASNTYDAAMLAVLAIQRAGSTKDPVAIRDGLWQVVSTEPGHGAVGPLDLADAYRALARGEEIHYKGASSRIVMDEYGTVSNPAIVWRVRDGAFETVERYDEDRIQTLLDAEDATNPECPPQ